MEDATSEQSSLLARIEEADDLAPTVGSGRAPVPVTVGGNTYNGIAAVPLADLGLCSAAGYEAMKPALRSHRSRKLMEAVKKGKFSTPEVEALQAKGVLPN